MTTKKASIESWTAKPVMVAGHLCLDISPEFEASRSYRFDDTFSPGRLTRVGTPTVSLGGVVANTGLTLAKLGLDVRLNGLIGNDAFGRIMEERLGHERVSTVAKRGGPGTSYSIVLALPGFDRFFLHYPGRNDDFSSDDIDYETAAKCSFFHFGYPPLMKKMYENGGEELARIFQKVKHLGVTTCLDMAMPDPSSPGGVAPWGDILKEVLPYTDIFVPSLEEIAFMIDRKLFEEKKRLAGKTDPVVQYTPDDCSTMSEHLIALGSGIVVIKCGFRGLYMRTGKSQKLKTIPFCTPQEPSCWHAREIWAPSFKADMFKSALGAGDTTIAGFIRGILEGFSPTETLRTANLMGWQNVQTDDTLSGIRTWNETLDLLGCPPEVNEQADLFSPGWHYDKKEKVFIGPRDGRG